MTNRMTNRKTVFIDMDGVLASYADENDKVNAHEFPVGFFYHRQPVYQVMDKILEVYGKEHLAILSAVPHGEAIIEKDMWLDKYFPVKKEDRHYVMWKQETKQDFIQNYCEENNIDIKNVVLIDDEHEILRNVEGIGCQVYHISRILTLSK